MIPFNIQPALEKSFNYMRQAALERHKLCGDGEFTRRCSAWLEGRTGTEKALLTTSCTHALEMAVLTNSLYLLLIAFVLHRTIYYPLVQF